MQPYRMEMGRKIDTERGANLYQFWKTQIAAGLNRQLRRIKSDCLINLASQEYFKAVDTRALDAQVITPEFKERKNGQYRMIGVYAKKARGQLSRHIIRNRLTEPESIKSFDAAGYRFNPELSDATRWVFTRNQP